MKGARRKGSAPAIVITTAAALILSSAHALAQEGGGTDHFKCYVVTELTLEQPVQASLEDQFGVQPDVMIHNARWFCNPVAKTREGFTTPIEEPLNHLTLYPISHKDPEPRRLVTIRNQFGLQELVLAAPRLLAVPTQKAPLGPPVGISHFKCYEARSPALNEPVNLEDQFHVEQARVLSSTFFCNPATKSVDGVVTPPEGDEDHLTCYKITPSRQPPAEFVDIRNQIDAEDSLMVGPSQYLCVPTEKLNVRSGGRQPHGDMEGPETATGD